VNTDEPQGPVELSPRVYDPKTGLYQPNPESPRVVAWVQSVHEMIADEPHPHGVRVSVQPSRETEGAAEIHLFTQSPYHLSVIKVPSGSQNVEGLYGAGLMQHERAVKNLGGRA
jgi:hypothetical protein